MKKIINVICKILLVLSYLLILSKLYVGNVKILLEVIILVVSTIAILKTNLGNCKLFLILGIVSLCIILVVPVILGLGISLFLFLFKLLGIFKGESFLDWLKVTFNAIITVKGFLLLVIVLLLIGISFLIIYKRNNKIGVDNNIL